MAGGLLKRGSPAFLSAGEYIMNYQEITDLEFQEGNARSLDIFRSHFSDYTTTNGVFKKYSVAIRAVCSYRNDNVSYCRRDRLYHT